VARIIPEAIAKVHADKFNDWNAFLECTDLDDERTSVSCESGRVGRPSEVKKPD
jgi:hypothetical protein